MPARAPRLPPAGGADPAQMLQAEAAHDPQPVQRWLVGAGLSGNSQRSAGAKKAAAAAFNAPGGPASLCKQAVTGRYPFTAERAERHSAGRLRPAVRAERHDQPVLQHAASPVRGYLRRDLEGAAGGGVAPPVSARRPGAVPARGTPSASCSSPAAGRSRACGSTSRRRRWMRGAKQVTLELGSQVITYAHGPQRADVGHLARRPAWTARGWCSIRRRPAAAVLSGDRSLGAVPPVRQGHAATGAARRTATR